MFFVFFSSNLLTFLCLVYGNFSSSKWLDFHYLQYIYLFTKSLYQHSPTYVANLVPVLLALMWESPSWTQSYKICSWVHGLAPALVNTPTKCLAHFLAQTQWTCLLRSDFDPREGEQILTLWYHDLIKESLREGPVCRWFFWKWSQASGLSRHHRWRRKRSQPKYA